MTEQALTSRSTVAIAGTFDVQNFGDMLFPLVAQWRLAPYNIDVEAFSPKGGLTGWQDCAPCYSYNSLLERSDRLAALLVGGGNIIHRQLANLDSYSGAMDRWAYSGLWGGAGLVAAILNKPLLWNAPGVPKAFDAFALAGMVHPLLHACDYISVRDEQSRDWLASPESVKVSVIPDTAVEVALMWPKASLRSAHDKLLARKKIGSEQRYAVFHIKRRSLQAGAEESVTAGIDAFARTTGLMPMLLAIGPCHGDDSMARELGRKLTVPHMVVDDATGLREIAAAIAYADQYVGCSLHGYITALAFGVPGRIVAAPLLPKHAGFLAHVNRPKDLTAGWSEALKWVANQEKRDMRPPQIPAAVFRAVDAHWAQMAEAILHPLPGGYLRRTQFLRKFVRSGIDRKGWTWTLPGFLLEEGTDMARKTESVPKHLDLSSSSSEADSQSMSCPRLE